MTYRTYHQYLNHPRFIAIKKQVMNRDNNRCVDCNQPATEVHHERYCEWGKFDVVSNLVAVCHSCHCNRHRCEQCNEIKLKAFEIKRQRKTCRACYQGQQ